jgi:hypothetical protein
MSNRSKEGQAWLHTNVYDEGFAEPKREGDPHHEPRTENTQRVSTQEVEDLKVKLRSILTCLDEGIPFGVTGSPVRDILRATSDLIYVLGSSFYRNRGVSRTPGLKFQEEDTFEDLPVGSQGSFGDYNERIYWSPVPEGSWSLQSIDKQGKFHYQKTEKSYGYRNTTDLLGNPLQISVEFEPELKFTHEIVLKIRQFFEDIDQILVFLSEGHVDFKFFRTLNRLLHPRISSTRQSKDHKSDQKRRNVSYFKRKHPRGNTPSTAKNTKQKSVHIASSKKD